MGLANWDPDGTCMASSFPWPNSLLARCPEWSPAVLGVPVLRLPQRAFTVPFRPASVAGRSVVPNPSLSAADTRTTSILGSEIIFTGHGGQDASKRQIADQSFTDSGNAALVSSQQLGQPVRVVRGAGGDELLSPTEGYRYDGLYTVLDHWMETGLSGFQVCRFRLFEVGTGGDRTFEDEALPQGNHNPEFTTRSSTSPARDGTVTRRIKSLYEHACQMCDITIESPKGPIAEGAHVRPLGRPHNGPDVPANVLCLCPNCHRKFDAGAVHITDTFRVIDFEGLLVGPLHRDSRHKIAVEHLAYHRQVICGLEE